MTKVFCKDCKYCKWIDLSPACVIRFSDLMAYYKLSRSKMIDKLIPSMIYHDGVIFASLNRINRISKINVNTAEVVRNCFNDNSYMDNSNSNPYIVFNMDVINQNNDCKYYSPSLLYKVKHLFSNRKE